MNSTDNEILPQGYKMTELGPLPEEWEVVQLENKYIEFQNGLWKGKKEPYINVRVLRNTNFNNDGTIDFDDVAELDVEQRNFKNREIIKEDIILERSGGGPTQPVGRVVFFEKNDQLRYSFSNFTSRIRVIDKLIIFPKYLFFYLLDFYYQGKTNDIQNRTTGIRNLDFSKYKQIPIPLPPLPEQQKMAAVLSAVQEAKEKTQAVIDATKALKKSMMKHLFTYGPVSPEETENVPLKETEIGLVPEDWEVVRLGEMAENRKETVDPNKEDIIYVGLEHIDSGDSKLKKYGNSREIKSSKSRFYKDDILYAKLRPYLDKGILAEFEGICSTDIIVIKPNKGLVKSQYLTYLLHMPNFLDFATKSMTGVNHPRTSWSILKSFNIPLPPLPVQQKIASILSAIDEKIQAEEAKEKALEDLFRSLLSHLMSGKIRVKDLVIGDW